MCFVNDYDWTASVVENSDCVTTTDKVRCDECRVRMPLGAKYRHVSMQEYEMCQACESGECECPPQNPDEYHECHCEKPELGNEDTYTCCWPCWCLRKGIEQVEIINGCKGDETTPASGQMFEMLRDEVLHGARDEVKRYFLGAKEMFPDEWSKIKWLWRRVAVIGE